MAAMVRNIPRVRKSEATAPCLMDRSALRLLFNDDVSSMTMADATAHTPLQALTAINSRSCHHLLESGGGQTSMAFTTIKAVCADMMIEHR
jgi:hypothetical protein